MPVLLSLQCCFVNLIVFLFYTIITVTSIVTFTATAVVGYHRTNTAIAVFATGTGIAVACQKKTPLPTELQIPATVTTLAVTHCYA